MPKVVVSGGFDPVHIGHINLFHEASKLGRLTVIVNNDNWLRAKKGFVFMGEEERMGIIKAFRFVDATVLSNHEKDPQDMSVSCELQQLKPDIFANGGDRRSVEDLPESETCEKYGIEMAFNVGGEKVQSSSWLTKRT